VYYTIAPEAVPAMGTRPRPGAAGLWISAAARGPTHPTLRGAVCGQGSDPNRSIFSRLDPTPPGGGMGRFPDWVGCLYPGMSFASPLRFKAPKTTCKGGDVLGRLPHSRTARQE